MKFTVILGATLLLLGVGMVLAGYLLPATRQGSAAHTFDAPHDLLRSTILDIDAQPEWRAGVAAIKWGPDGTWTEITADGERIVFRILEDTPDRIVLGFESARGYTGRWEGAVAQTPTGATALHVREEVATPSPVARILSRLFFNPAAFAATYLQELDAEVARRSTGAK